MVAGGVGREAVLRCFRCCRRRRRRRRYGRCCCRCCCNRCRHYCCGCCRGCPDASLLEIASRVATAATTEAQETGGEGTPGDTLVVSVQVQRWSSAQVVKSGGRTSEPTIAKATCKFCRRHPCRRLALMATRLSPREGSVPPTPSGAASSGFFRGPRVLTVLLLAILACQQLANLQRVVRKLSAHNAQLVLQEEQHLLLTSRERVAIQNKQGQHAQASCIHLAMVVTTSCEIEKHCG